MQRSIDVPTFGRRALGRVRSIDIVEDAKNTRRTAKGSAWPPETRACPHVGPIASSRQHHLKIPTRLRIGGQSVRCQTRCESLPNCTQIGHSAESTKYVAGQQNTHVTWCKIDIDVRNKPAQRSTRARQHLGEARPRRWRLRHYQQSSATASRCSSRTCSTESNLPHDGTRKHPTRFRGFPDVYFTWERPLDEPGLPRRYSWK